MHRLALFLGFNAFVLTSFHCTNSASEGEEYVIITGRKSGIISWLLTLCGLESKFDFRIFADHIEFKEKSISGELQTNLHLKSVSVAQSGFFKPFFLLVLGFIFTILAFPTLGITLILAIPCFIYYFLNKNFLIGVIPHSGTPIAICFKRSVIENVKLEYEHAQGVIQLLNALINQVNNQ